MFICSRKISIEANNNLFVQLEDSLAVTTEQQNIEATTMSDKVNPAEAKDKIQDNGFCHKVSATEGMARDNDSGIGKIKESKEVSPEAQRKISPTYPPKVTYIPINPKVQSPKIIYLPVNPVISPKVTYLPLRTMICHKMPEEY